MGRFSVSKVFLTLVLLSLVRVDSGWASLLSFVPPLFSAGCGAEGFCELTGSPSKCLCRSGKLIGEASVAATGGFPIEAVIGSDLPQAPSDPPVQIGRGFGLGMACPSNSRHRQGANAAASIICQQFRWVAVSPIRDWMSNRVPLIWLSPPIRQLLKVPIA
jgi:hypothetical protein